MVERDTPDVRVVNETEIPVEALKAALTGDSLPAGEQLVRCAERLLCHALERRDTDAAHILTRLMDTDPLVDAALDRILNDVLYEQPDSVYVFVRARVGEGPDGRWLARLKMAALFSLRVAINDGDTETLMNWLTLVSREPASYEVNDVLHYGILAAQPRGHQDPDLARQLLMLAVRRAPEVLDALLDNADLLAVLPDNMGRVLRELDGDPLLFLQKKGVDFFLVAMLRAARARAGQMFTPTVIAQIWSLYTGAHSTNNASQPVIHADAIVDQWVSQGVDYFTPESLETLLILMLASRRDDLVVQLVHQPNGTITVLPLLVSTLESSQRNINDALDLIGRIVTSGDISIQQAAAMYITMLDGLDWRRETLPLMQQLARAVQQSAFVPGVDVLWRMLSAGAETRDELVTRVALKRLFVELEHLDDDSVLVNDLKRMSALVPWSEAAQALFVNWWRAFTRQQPVARLQRLDKALDGKRGLEEERAILQTLIAARRMLGSRSMAEFAKAVGIVYDVLETLAESFDPSSKRANHFDQDVLRAELDAHKDEITPQEQQILANNLKELAHLIAEMGDNRTKANLMRRGDDLDRDLMSGEQASHSAVDAMKWLSGYWGGAQDETEQGN